VPRLRLHLIRFHGVLAPNAKLRALVVPAGQDQDAGASGGRRHEVRLRTRPASAHQLGPAAQAGVVNGRQEPLLSGFESAVWVPGVFVAVMVSVPGRAVLVLRTAPRQVLARLLQINTRILDQARHRYFFSQPLDLLFRNACHGSYLFRPDVGSIAAHGR